MASNMPTITSQTVPTPGTPVSLVPYGGVLSPHIGGYTTRVTILANPSNTGNIKVGIGSGNATSVLLAAGQAFTISTLRGIRLMDIYIDADVAGEGVSCEYDE